MVAQARSSPVSEQELPGLSEAVVRTVREPLVVLDSRFRVRAANPAFCQSFRLDLADTIGKPLFEIGSGQWDIPSLRHLLEDVLPRNSVVEEFEVEHNFPEIGTRCMLLNGRRLEGDVDGGELILLAIQDVTEQRRIERDLRRSNEELERFAYVASHDLQEPLRMVASYTRLLGRRYEGQLDDRADKYIRYAAEGAERMKALIQDLLAYSRVGTDGGEPALVDPNEILGDVLQDFRITVRKSGARITHDSLPSAFVDPAQLRQLFQNLIENGIKFSGDDAPEIHVSGRQEGAHSTFSVRDRGIGIDPQYFDRIFIIFQRLHGRETSGTGIGLALSKRIVERHGGRLWVESTPGEGSTFYFTLPSEEA